MWVHPVSWWIMFWCFQSCRLVTESKRKTLHDLVACSLPLDQSYTESIADALVYITLADIVPRSWVEWICPLHEYLCVNWELLLSGLLTQLHIVRLAICFRRAWPFTAILHPWNSGTPLPHIPLAECEREARLPYSWLIMGLCAREVCVPLGFSPSMPFSVVSMFMSKAFLWLGQQPLELWLWVGMQPKMCHSGRLCMNIAVPICAAAHAVFRSFPVDNKYIGTSL